MQDFTAMIRVDKLMYHIKLFRTYIICSVKDKYNYIYITRNYDQKKTDTQQSFEDFYKNQNKYETPKEMM